MNAPNSVEPSATGGDVRPYEPSMEEILASIRRIIADDQSLPGRLLHDVGAGEGEDTTASVHVLHAEQPTPAAAVEPETPAHAEAEEPAMMAQGTIAAPQYPSPEAPTAGPASPEPNVAVHRDTAVPAPETAAVASSRETSRGGDDDGGDYFDPPQEYDRPVAVAPSEPASLFSATTNSSVTSAFNVLAASRLADNSDELLGMTREMIRPLLRAWLDENLPSMVERLVREEIERVARGGR